MLTSILIALAAALPSSDVATSSPATDGADAFFNLCGGTVAGVEMPLDVPRFQFTQIDPKVFRKVRPTEKGPYWDVHASSSGLRALVHIWSNGNCSLEITEAGEQATRTAFDGALARFGAALGGAISRKQDKVEMKDGQPMTSSEWSITSPKGNYLVGLTTYPEAKYMTQHILLLRRSD